MEMLSPSTLNGVAASIPPSTADPLQVLEHIAALIQTTLGVARKELEAVGSLLSKTKHSETLSRCARFASESQVALYAQKDLIEEKLANGHDERLGNRLFQLRRSMLTYLFQSLNLLTLFPLHPRSPLRPWLQWLSSSDRYP